MPIQARPVSDWGAAGAGAAGTLVWRYRPGIVAVFLLAFMLVTLSYLREQAAGALQTSRPSSERSER